MTTQSTQEADERASRMKFWGGAVILLMMVLMVFSTNIASQFARSRAGAGATPVGTASGGRTVTVADKDQAKRLLDALEEIYVMLPIARTPQPIPLATACWGEQVVRDFKAHPEALALLLQEATANGPGATAAALGSLDPTQHSTDAPGLMNSGELSSDQLRPVPGSILSQLVAYNGPQPRVQVVVRRGSADGRALSIMPAELPPADQEQIYAAVQRFLTIQSAGALVGGAAKISEPMVDRLIAERQQRFTLQLATFDAVPKFNATTTQPTDAQLATHLAAYADQPAGTVTRDDPFGFGYRVPDRVKLEMISFKRSDVAALVTAERKPYDWEVSARKTFARDRSIFTDRLPTTHPARVAASQPSMPQPAFDTLKDQAVQIEIDREVDARVGEIEQLIRSTLVNDFQGYSSARSQHATTAPSSFGVAYDSGEYLDHLAATVQARYKLLPAIARYGDTFRDAPTLGLLGSFSHALWTVPPAVASKLRLEDPMVPAPAYATQFARDLMTPAMLSNVGETVLDVYEPSDVVVGDAPEGERFFFRITATDKHHPASAAADLERLRPQLTFDWRLAEAQRQTLADATAAAANLSPDSTLQLPGTPVLTVNIGPFGGRDVPPPPRELALDARSYPQFAQGVNDQLLGDPSRTPIAVIDVPLARRTFIVRRVAMSALWATTSDLDTLRIVARHSLATDPSFATGATDPDAGPAESAARSWIDAKKILERNEYKSERPE